MSGGAFDYKQHHIRDIYETIQNDIDKNGKLKTKEELKGEVWMTREWYEEYPEDLYHKKYEDEVIEKFKEAVEVLKKAYTYAHRIDWLLSGDDGEESFLRRLKEEL
jgi:hypothetical protein